jgi:hypothetical protein
MGTQGTYGRDVRDNRGDGNASAPATPYVMAMREGGDGRHRHADGSGPSWSASSPAGIPDQRGSGGAAAGQSAGAAGPSSSATASTRASPPIGNTLYREAAGAHTTVREGDARPSGGPVGRPPTEMADRAGAPNGISTPENPQRVYTSTANGGPLSPAESEGGNRRLGLSAGGDGSSAGPGIAYHAGPQGVDVVMDGGGMEGGEEAVLLPPMQNGHSGETEEDVDMAQARTGGVKRDRPDSQEKGSAGLQKGFLLQQRRVKPTGVGSGQHDIR